MVPPNSAQTAVPSQGQSCPGENPVIIPIPRVFLSWCINLYLYLYHARPNDHYYFSVLGLFIPVSASTLTIFEEFSSQQIIIDSPVHTIWSNIIAEPVLCLTFLLEPPQ